MEFAVSTSNQADHLMIKNNIDQSDAVSDVTYPSILGNGLLEIVVI